MNVPQEVAQWKFGNFQGNLRSNEHYKHDQGMSLKCTVKGQYLNWQDESVGINLGLGTGRQTKYHLHLPDGQERDILCGEPVAIANGGGDPYIVYNKRTIGINLGWSGKASYQWRIFATGVEVGEPIPRYVACAIHNEEVEPDPDWLIYFPRPGGDIGWTSSPHWYESVTDVVKKAIIKAAKDAVKAYVLG